MFVRARRSSAVPLLDLTPLLSGCGGGGGDGGCNVAPTPPPVAQPRTLQLGASIRRRQAYAHLTVALLAVSGVASEASAESSQGAARQTLADAWWTGPLIAPGAATLPKGRALVEPYLFDIIREGRYDARGERQSTTRSHAIRSLTYLLYGLTDELTVGMIPVAGCNDPGNGSGRSSVQLGDVTVQGQYRLTQFREGGWWPTTSIVLQQTLPTGDYDRLMQPSDGLGTGAYTTNLALRSQYFLWLPNGRILRTRFHLAYSMSDPVDIKDVSIYGTSRGFRGRVEPGDVFTINSSWEYSITRNWVFALDFVYQYDESTQLRGQQLDHITGAREDVDVHHGSAWRFGVAPAIEYNWSANVGVIVGARWYVAGRNTNATVTPLAAINLVF